MSDFYNSVKSAFLEKTILLIEEHLADEDFGVSELASLLHMSRSNLLRKIKKETGLSVSVLIRNVRLHNAQLLLKDTSLTVSEVSYKVGFKSASYFTKCFRDLYGYTPGEAASKLEEEVKEPTTSFIKIEPQEVTPFKFAWLTLAIIIGLTSILAVFIYAQKEKSESSPLKKSIAVLPFKNDSNDSSNVYIMNGLMEAILDNFQKIEDIEITSRTTVEKFRGVPKTIPELSNEMNVNYFVEGSGQKIGNEILLTIQLIEAPTDRNIWSQRYKRNVEDIFLLQTEVAQSIAREIDAVITPEEKKRIEKIPTNNLVAYDYYLKGLSLLKAGEGDDIIKALEQFKKAILEDGQFAHSYAYVAICYYYIDFFKAEKKYKQEMKDYVDKAILLDGELGESLIAEAFYYTQEKQYESAAQSFEKVLLYYPNSSETHNYLSEIFAIYLPNTEKYLLHAIQGAQAVVAEEDSAAVSTTYLHISNALAQSGFINEAEKYVQHSLAYNSDNLYAQYLNIFIDMATNMDLDKTKEELLKVLQEDPNRIDIIQELAKLCYTMKEYEEAWTYYNKLIQKRDSLGLELYQNEDLNIGFVLNELEDVERSKSFYNSFLEYANSDQSMYKELHLSSYYAAIGDIDKAIAHFDAFSNLEGYQYWIVLFLDKDPILQKMAGHSDFNKISKKIKEGFWIKHKETKGWLKKEKVI